MSNITRKISAAGVALAVAVTILATTGGASTAEARKAYKHGSSVSASAPARKAYVTPDRKAYTAPDRKAY